MPNQKHTPILPYNHNRPCSMHPNTMHNRPPNATTTPQLQAEPVQAASPTQTASRTATQWNGRSRNRLNMIRCLSELMQHARKHAQTCIVMHHAKSHIRTCTQSISESEPSPAPPQTFHATHYNRPVVVSCQHTSPLKHKPTTQHTSCSHQSY
eukprot:scpid51333/ scgid8188/ 